MTTKVSLDLDAIDRRIAELCGWKWDDGPIVVSRLGLMIDPPSGQLDGFQPTRDARQAMVLLSEISNSTLIHHKGYWGEWTCFASTPDGPAAEYQYGDTPLIAICKAWIAWKEATA